MGLARPEHIPDTRGTVGCERQFLARTRSTRTHLPWRQFGDEQTRSWQGRTGEDDAEATLNSLVRYSRTNTLCSIHMLGVRDRVLSGVGGSPGSRGAVAANAVGTVPGADVGRVGRRRPLRPDLAKAAMTQRRRAERLADRAALARSAFGFVLRTFSDRSGRGS